MKEVKVGKSKIHGKGLFSKEPIKKGDLITKVHAAVNVNPELKKFIPNELGKFYNHTDKGANVSNEIIGDGRYLRALKSIPANTELAANYREHSEMEQPEDFDKTKYASFDYDDTFTTPEGLARAKELFNEGYNLFIISARDEITPEMVLRAQQAGIPRDNIIVTGSDEAKVAKVKALGIQKHFDNKSEVINQLGELGEQFRKGGFKSKKYTSNLLGKNRLFVKNGLLKKKSVKNKIYDPNSPYFEDGGYMDLDLDEEAITKYKEGGYIVEELDDYEEGGALLTKKVTCKKCGWTWDAADGGDDVTTCHKCGGQGLVHAEYGGDISVPSLTRMDDGGEKNKCKDGEYWDGTKCTKLISYATDKKLIDGVSNWAMHSANPDQISSEYNDQIKHYLYSGKYGYDPVSMSLIPLSTINKKLISEPDQETKKILAKQDDKAAYTQSIIDAGFDPNTFGKSKGTNVITGEEIYGDKSQGDVDKINKEAVNDFVTEGHRKAILESPFNTAAFFTPAGMAAGVMQGAANLLPDAYDFAKDPSWSGAGAVGMDALMMSPVAKGLGKALSFKGVPKELPGSPNASDNVQKAGFLNPLALIDRVTPRLPSIPTTFPLGIEDDIVNWSPLNLIPGYGKRLAEPGFTNPMNSKNTGITAYRKFGNSLDDLKNSKTFRPKGGFRMGAKQIQTEGNWAEPGIANEHYKGVFAASMDPRVPGTNIELQAWHARNGVVGRTKQGNPAIPITDSGFELHRRLPWSNKYVPIDKQKLIDNKFQLATQLPHVQSLIEKYGIAAGYGLISGYLANGKEGAIENLKTINKYTADPLINWSKTAWDDLKNKLDQKEEGGSMEMDLTREQINEYKKGGWIVEELDDYAEGGQPCPDGYTWDETKQDCVSLIDTDWLSNWYANRKLPLDEIPNKKYVNLMKERLPQYNPESTLLEELANMPPVEYQDVIDDDPNNQGQLTYDKDWNPDKILLKKSLLNDPVRLNQTYNSEASTAADVNKEGLFAAQNMVIDPGLVLFEDRWGDLKGSERDAAEDHYDYVTDPEQDNIHSLVFEERYKRNLKPDQVLTEEDINKWKSEAEAKGALDRNSPNFDDGLYTLFKLAKDNKSLMNWFNQLASNDKPKTGDEPQYTKQGGAIGYELGDEIDEATMQKLKKLGYTFETI